MKPLLNLDEPVQRRSGEPAEILKRDALGSFPVVALLTNILGTAQYSQSFTMRGSYATDAIDNPNDLINVPKRVLEGTVFLRCYLMEDGRIEVREGCSTPDYMKGSSRVVGARAFRLGVKSGEWI